jgi:predicted esterase
MVNGHTVYQLLADYQSRTNGGNGLLRILEFRPAEDKIYVKTFSPYLNSYESDSDSEVTLDYDMTGSTEGAISISLQSPDNGTTTVDNMPDFKFIVTHPTHLIFNCSLWLQNSTFSNVFATKNDVVNGSLTTVTPMVPLSNGDWWWWINCTDGSTSSISDKRRITINVFRGDKAFTSSYDGSARYYWLDLPDNFDNSSPTPLVFFLHGYGGSRLSYSQKYPLLRQIFQNHTWIVAAVDCRVKNGYQNWYAEPSRQDITDVLNMLRHDYYIDSDHVHIMGNSMGGGGALKYAMFNNEVIASIVDIHGITNFTQFYIETTTYKASLEAAYGGTPSQFPEVYANESALGNEIRFMHTPVMMLHGTADDQVSVSQSRYLNQSLSALGYTVKYIEVPGVTHDAQILITGREMEIFNWFNDHPLWQAPLVQVSLAIQVFGNGVTNSTGTTLHNQYDSVTVLATPDSGYVLSYWLLNGTNIGSANPYTLYMNANYNLTAVFTPVQVTWWNLSWLYRKPIVLTENSGLSLSDYQMKVIASYVPSKMKTDFSDLRFTDSNKATLLPYWIESYNASAAIVWVKVPSIQASGAKTIYMYYGNPSAVSAGNGTATFDFFDDFNDGIVDTSKWVTSGTVRETSGYLQVGSYSGSIARQNTALYPLFSRPYMFRSRSLVSTTFWVYAYVGFANSGLTRFALAPHSYRSYYTYNGSTGQYTTNTAGLRSFAIYDIVWTTSSVKYYQNSVLRATHTNSPSVTMGAYLGANSTAYVRCDWILAHKYASADPSIATGQEEGQVLPVQVSLTTTVSGNGVTNATGTGLYDLFSNVTVSATPNSGYMLSYWLLNGTSVGSANPYTINMTANYNLTAVFAPVMPDQVSLTVGVSGNGVTNATGVQVYPKFTNVTVAATPDSGYVLDHWLLNGTAVGSVNPSATIFSDGFEGQWTWQDEFTSKNARWSWSYYQGTGYHICPTTIDGFVVAENGITDETTGDAYSDCALPSAQTIGATTSIVLEGRFRFTDDNGVTDNGKGSRGFGVWDGSANVAWFMSCSPESAEEYRGLRAIVQKAGSTVLNTALSSIDIKQWHTYKIVITATTTTFYIDEQQVAYVANRPNVMAEIVMWIDNYRVPQMDYLDVVIDQKMYIDYVYFFQNGGGFSAWTGTSVAGTGASITVQSTTKHHGNYAVQAVKGTSAEGYAYCYKTFASTYSTLYVRVLVRFTATPASGVRFELFGISEASLNYNLATLFLYNNAGTLNWDLQYKTDAVTENHAYSTTPTISVNTWYPMEIRFHAATSTGDVKAWIVADGGSISEGTPTISVTGLTNDDILAQTLALCVLTSSTAGYTCYYDCVVVADAYIGPETTGGTNFTLNPYTINMTANYNLTAVFVPVAPVQVSLTVGVTGNGATNATGVHVYDRFTKVTVLATPSSGYVLDHWLLNGTGVGSVNPFTLNMTNSFELTAVFTPVVLGQVSLTAGVSGNGVTNATGTGLYDLFRNVTVSATPDSGYVLSYWLLNGTKVGSANPYTINMTANYNLTAVFVPVMPAQVSLTVGVTGNGATNATGVQVYPKFTNVTVSATPNSGYTLSYWLLNGTNVGSANPYTINMTANYNLTAVFAPIQVKTFGNSNILPSTDGYFSANQKAGCKFTLSEAGTVTRITAYVWAASGTANLKAVIYADNSGSPGAKQGTDSQQTSVTTTHGWYNFTFSTGISLSAGTYWLTLITSAQTYWAYGGGSTNQSALNGDTYSDGATNPFGTGSVRYNLVTSIYATYT